MALRLLHRLTVPSRLLLVALVVGACAFAAPVASAAKRVRALAPANGAVLPVGVVPRFVISDPNDGMATLEVSASPDTDVDGVFTDPVWSTGYDSRAGRRRITLSPERSSSRSRFWNKPGIYYWHAYRVECPYTGPRPHTCRQRVITSTRRFTVARRASPS
jgi:hypothetical protein